MLVVGASLDSAHGFLLAAARERGAAFGWRRTTLGLLAGDLAAASLAESNRAPISTLGTEAIAARVAAKLRFEGTLGKYREVSDTPGFVRAVARTIAELRMAAARPEEVEPVRSELAVLLRRFSSELAEQGLTDRAEVLAIATEAASDPEISHLSLGHATLLLDLPLHSVSERDFAAALIRRAPEALITLPAGDEATRRHWLDVLGSDANAQASSKPPDQPSVDEDAPPAAAEGTALSRLQNRLFGEEAPAESEPDGSVVVLSAPGENRECVEIARKALEFARAGISFDRIAVLLRSPDEYRTHLEEAFDRAGVPVHFARGVVRPDPSGRAFLALLKCRAEEYSASQFAEYLSLGQVPDATTEGAPPDVPAAGNRWAPGEEEGREPLSDLEERDVPQGGAAVVPRKQSEDDTKDSSNDPDPERPVEEGTLRAPRRWEHLIVEASVVGGIDRWRRRLGGLQAQLDIERESLEDGGGSKAEAIQRKIADLSHLKTYALPLLEELERLPGLSPWSVWLDRLSSLATRSLRVPDRVLSLLTELAPLGPVGPVDIQEVLRVLSNHLLELRLLPEERRYGRLFVAGTEAGRGRSFDVVFVPGLSERSFPRKISEDPILLDADRRRISSALQDNEDRIANERLALRLAVGAAKDRVVFSYPRLDVVRSRPRVPSFYALEGLRAAEGRLPLFEELAKRAEAVTETRVGWPAPRASTDAIDEAEYDLAVLDSLQGRDPRTAKRDEATGAARYLLDANPHLARALRARAYRWIVRKWSEADGLVDPSEAALEALAGHAFDARPYSATALQHYATCPYRFLLATIQRLEPRDEPGPIDQLDPLQKGGLIHDIQWTLLTQLKQEALLPVRPENLDDAIGRLDETVDQVAAEHRDKLVPAIERVWEDGIEAIRADLRQWLRLVAQDTSGFVPWRFELAFGLPRRERKDPDSRDEPVELDAGVTLRGSIDLVERREDGALRITDHKSGKARVPRGAVVDGGSTLQPVLYALSAEKLYPKENVLSGRLFYCTSDGGYKVHEVPVDAGARGSVERVVQLIRAETEAGFLPAVPKKNACRWCDYHSVCGPREEQRTARKPVIPSLKELRELP